MSKMSKGKIDNLGDHFCSRPKGPSGKLCFEQQVNSAKITKLVTPSRLSVVTYMTSQLAEDEDCSSASARNKTPNVPFSVSTTTSASSSPRDSPFTPPSPNLSSSIRPTKATLPEVRARRKLTLAANGTRNMQKDSKAGKIVPEGIVLFQESKVQKKRCAWITSQSDATYVLYHDEEWGVPVHDDKNLFELLILGGARAEITWCTILNKRDFYRSIFADFNPAAVAAYDEDKMASLTANGDIVLSDARIRSIVNNAKLVLEIVKQFGSLDQYLWGFMSYKPIVNSHRHPNFIPVRTAKSDAISKDLQKRGFRHAGSMVVYSLMQAAGMTNDHLAQCFRHKECKALQEQPQKSEGKPRAVQRDQLKARKTHKPVASPVSG